MSYMFYNARNFDQDVNGWNVSRVVDLPAALCAVWPRRARECLRGAALRGAALTSPQYSAMELVAGLCELAAVCTNRTGRRHAAVSPKV